MTKATIMKIVQVLQFKEVIPVPSHIALHLQRSFMLLEGPLGSIQVSLPQKDGKGLYAFAWTQSEEGTKALTLFTQSKKAQLALGAFRTLLTNYFYGLSRGFLCQLEILGVGYRVTLKKNYIELKIGLSHTVRCFIPKDIQIFLPKSTLICVFGIDKTRVHQIASKLRQIRPPEPYKGKGIRFLHEHILKKEGKKK